MSLSDFWKQLEDKARIDVEARLGARGYRRMKTSGGHHWWAVCLTEARDWSDVNLVATSAGDLLEKAEAARRRAQQPEEPDIGV